MRPSTSIVAVQEKRRGRKTYSIVTGVLALLSVAEP